MKITKERLVEIIKEELQNTQMESEFKKPSYASDDYWKMHSALTDKFGDTYQKIDGRLQLVQTPAKQKLLEDIKALYPNQKEREVVIRALGTLSEVSIFLVAEIAHYVETKDKERLAKMVKRANAHGQAVIDSGSLGT